MSTQNKKTDLWFLRANGRWRTPKDANYKSMWDLHPKELKMCPSDELYQSNKHNSIT